MENSVIIGIVLILILVGTSIVFLSVVQTKVVNLKKEIKLLQTELESQVIRANQAVKNESIYKLVIEEGSKKYTQLKTTLKVISDNPILYLKVIGKDSELKTPALRLTAKGDNNNYTAFAYSGGEDLTDRLILLDINGKNLSETLTDL